MTKLALITGASGGLGEAFSRALAKQGYDLILIARNEQRLKSLASELSTQFSIQVEIILADLSKDEDIKKVTQLIQNLSHIHLLINNAGFGTSKHFVDSDIAKQVDMINVHITATTCLTHAALALMLKQNQGAIINVSSLISFMEVEYNVTYTASKSYLIPFSKILKKELKNSAIKIQALCPGFVRTHFFDTDEFTNLNIAKQIPDNMWITADEVVNISLQSLQKNKKVIVIPGWKNKLFAFFLALRRLFML